MPRISVSSERNDSRSVIPDLSAIKHEIATVRKKVVTFGEEGRGELKGNVASLPARSGIEDLSSLPVDPGCGKRSE